IRSAAVRPCARCDNFCLRNPSCRRRSVAVAQTNSPNPLRWSGFREKRSHIQAEDLIHEGLVHGLAHELTIAAGALPVSLGGGCLLVWVPAWAFEWALDWALAPSSEWLSW